jgi:aspartyl-tRNA(Asn)/glutamyl-tRNA(Gln) amidotransferase subunit B
MRIEANISVSKTDEFGTKVEVKNLNSFRSVERAIAFEVARQSEMIERGEKVLQETRGWDENKQVTFSQRIKEGSADYRYFPEPDLPKLVLSELPWLSEIRASLPELPEEKRARYETLGLKPEQAAHLAATVEDSAFFDAVLAELPDQAEQISLAANYFITDIAGAYGTLSPKAFADLIGMVSENKLSSRGAKDVLAILRDTGAESAEQVAAKAGLLQVSDTESLRRAVQEVIAANQAVVAEYRAGKESVLQYLVGQGMKATKGAGNPGVLKELFLEELA